MELLLLIVKKGYILIGGGDVSLPVWGPDFWGRGDLFPGGYFVNVRFMSLYLAEGEEEVSVLGDSNEGGNIEESDVA